MEFDPEHADAAAGDQRIAQWVTRLRPGRDGEVLWIGRGDEPGRFPEQGRPDAAVLADTAEHRERELRVKGTMLIRHERPDVGAADLRHLFAHAELRLQRLLAIVKDFQRVGHGLPRRLRPNAARQTFVVKFRI